MKVKTILGLCLGITGFILPFLINFSGLSFAGHIALGIFLMAATFWLFEPIPIYSTSILVIFLGVVFLSQQGLLFQNVELPVYKPILKESNSFEIPSSALTNNSEVYLLNNKNETVATKVRIIEFRGEMALIQSEQITPEVKIVSKSNHRLIGYKPVNFSDYFNTLANSIIILFLGGLLLADAATKYNLDQNLTRIILKPFGSRPAFITLGMLSVTATISAFMSNTAATAMMMTVVLPIIARLDSDDPFRKAIVLAIPFGANIGGIATPVGTPPNAVVLAALSKNGINIPFGTWCLMATPIAIIMVLVSWWVLIKIFPPKTNVFKLNMKGKFDQSPRAFVLYVVFAITVILWVTEAIHGIPSSLVAFFAVAALTVTNTVDVEDIQKLPWDVLWLVSGGIALDVSMRSTGMGSWLVSTVAWNQMGSLLVLLVFALVAILMSTFLSHTVTSTILAPLAVGIGLSGVLGGNANIAIALALVGISTSFAMALPISTPPNAIATSTGLINSKDMIKPGIAIGIIGIIIVLIFANLYWPLIVNIK